MTRPWSRARADRDLRQNFIIGSAALMIGMAVFFPLADDRGGVWFRSMTLALFFLAVPVFHALHLEPFIRTGRFTIPILLFLMLPIVLTAGPSRESLLPWLPFILTVMSFITVGVDEALPYLRRTNDDDSRFMRLESGRSTTVSTRPPPSNPRSPDPSDFRFTGPPSRAVSRCSGSEASSGVNLHSVQGVVRPSWGVSTLSFWQSQDAHEIFACSCLPCPTELRSLSYTRYSWNGWFHITALKDGYLEKNEEKT
ncbi:hypothetical protein VTJ04DRAFT_1143 [Mycothermus thermophilus]|uniref:uncharacterized protein n=1 Tax=Humicola insolens TaxID=85995 RepID=UPI003743A76D